MNIFLSIPAVVWLLISALFFACGEFLSKLWGNNPSINLTFLVVIAYVLCTLSWLPTLLHKNQLAIMGTAWLLFGMIATIFVGLFIFHEKATYLQFVGIIFALAAMILLNI